MLLPFNLRDQLLDVVQTPARLQSQFARMGMIRPGSRRLLNRLQSGAKGFIHNPTEGPMQLFCQRPRALQNIVFYR